MNKAPHKCISEFGRRFCFPRCVSPVASELRGAHTYKSYVTSSLAFNILLQREVQTEIHFLSFDDASVVYVTRAFAMKRSTTSLIVFNIDRRRKSPVVRESLSNISQNISHTTVISKSNFKGGQTPLNHRDKFSWTNNLCV